MTRREFPPYCYYCNCNPFGNVLEYERHVVQKHVAKPGYPGPADIKALNLKPQGMSWEKEVQQKEYYESVKEDMM